MKLFWKLFCSMVSITVLACAVGGFWLIDGQFRASFDQEVLALYEENDMLRYALSRELDRRVVEGGRSCPSWPGPLLLPLGGGRWPFASPTATGGTWGAATF